MILPRWIHRLIRYWFFSPRRVLWSVVFEEILTIQFEGKFKMNLSTEQKVKVTVRPVTAAGNPARIDGPVRFVSEDENVVRVEPIDDTSAWAIAVGEGTVRLTATFDADLDEDEVRFLSFDGEITVTAAEAAGAELEFGEPELLVLTPFGEPTIVEPAAEEPVVDEPADEAVVEESASEGDTVADTDTSADADEPRPEDPAQ